MHGSPVHLGMRGRRRMVLRCLSVTLGLALVVGACGERSDDAGSGTTGPGAAPGTDASTVRADTFSLRLPGGWSDQTGQFGRSLPVEPVKVLAGSTVNGFTTNVAILRATAAGPTDQPDRLAEPILDRIVRRLGARAAGSAGRLTVAGEEAATSDYTYAPLGVAVRARAVAFAHGDRLYVVLYSAAAQAFEPELADFRAILDSWAWT